MVLVSVDDYEQEAAKIIPKSAYDYYKSGAGNELSLNLNKKCYDKIRIRPKFLVDVSKRDMSCEIFGEHFSAPIGISPTAMQKMAHSEGECANARAAGQHKIPFILSTIATSSIEEVAQAAPNTVKWFQLYIYKDRSLTESLVHRAESANFKAIVLTVDAPVFGLRRADKRNAFTMPPHLKLANFVGEKSDFKSNEGVSGINTYVASQFDASLTWKDVKWLLSFTKLPVIVKGILTKEDAVIAVNLGVKGIIVSNHGARQIDSVPASIEALPEIVQAVGDRVTIMIDGGVTQGTDIFKAIALGAKMVFIGRNALWGLAVNGQKGVEHIIEILKNELDLAMTLAGTPTLKDINKEFVIHESYYSKL
uniref:(S)-2-hydroxy-acid oxidase n=1 Tax=Corethrella appendiculata TaxID=1370023 RepID=U5ETN3_9DIPT